MRVLHISTVTHGGGAARVARALHDCQRQRGIESVLLCGRGRPEEAEDVWTLGIEPWRHLGNVAWQRISGEEGSWNTRAWEHALGRYVKRAEVIHLHNAHGYYLPRRMLEEILARPAVWTLQDEWLLTGRCAFPLGCRGFENGCRPCPYPGRYPSAWIDRAGVELPRRRRLAHQANAIFVTPSAMIRARFLEQGFPADRFEVIHNPLDMDVEVSAAARREARRELGLPEDRTILLFVAAETWIPRKGLDVLDDAARQLREPEASYICVVGALNRQVRRMFADHPVEARLVGSVTDRARLAKYYLASDALVVPSLNESFGLIIIEAAAMGCRVVCSDLPVFREILGEEGLYFPLKDSRACARALEEVAANRRAESSLALASTVRSRFSIDRITDQYLATYDRVRHWTGESNPDIVS